MRRCIILNMSKKATYTPPKAAKLNPKYPSPHDGLDYAISESEKNPKRGYWKLGQRFICWADDWTFNKTEDEKAKMIYAIRKSIQGEVEIMDEMYTELKDPLVAKKTKREDYENTTTTEEDDVEPPPPKKMIKRTPTKSLNQ
jgi:hypothetical protein